MRDLGLCGVRRGKKLRTTVPDPAAPARSPDLLERDFTASAPNQRWVADFTYVRTWAGFVFVAFIVDVYAQRIVGWHAATTPHHRTGPDLPADGDVAARARRTPGRAWPAHATPRLRRGWRYPEESRFRRLLKGFQARSSA
jgi:transposase InsO family protein